MAFYSHWQAAWRTRRLTHRVNRRADSHCFPANRLQSASLITFAFYILLVVENVLAGPLGDDFVVREQRRVGASTLYVGYATKERYDSLVLIQFDDSGMVSHLFTGNNCRSPNAAPDLSRMIVYDGNNRSGSLVILVMEDCPTGEQSEEGGARGRRVEEDFATRETDFEQQKGLIPRQDFNREWIGLGAEFADANRLLIRSYRSTDEKKEFDTAVVYDFRSKAFSVPSCQENERIKQANFGEVGLERPVAPPRTLQLRRQGIRGAFFSTRAGAYGPLLISTFS
jgi:hypothetical protein